MMVTKTEFQNYFVEHLPALLPNLKVEAFRLDDRFKGNTFDFVAQVQVKGIRKTLLGDVEAIGQPRHLRRAITELRESGVVEKEAYFIVAAPYVSKQGLDVCRRNQIGCLDLAGNLYMEFDGIYIERIVNTNPKPERRAIKSLFTPIASRIVRALLVEPKRTWRLTELSSLAEASIGQVYNVSRKLCKEGLAHKTNRDGLTLTEPATLLEMWQNYYQISLNNVHRFHLPAQNITTALNQIQVAATKANIQVACTSHTGFNLLTDSNATEADDIRLYIESNQIKLLTEQLPLKASDFSGNLHLLNPYDEGIFYQLTPTATLPVVSNIQLYLDIYSDPSQDQRKAKYLRKSVIGF